MTEQPRAVLGRILNDFGSTLIEVVAGKADPARTASGVQIQDPLPFSCPAMGRLASGSGMAVCPLSKSMTWGV
ncbi:hypothetical protein, partial [Streptomyces sp. NPDC001880]